MADGTWTAVVVEGRETTGLVKTIAEEAPKGKTFPRLRQWRSQCAGVGDPVSMLSRNVARIVAVTRRAAVRRPSAIRNLTDNAVEQPHVSANVSAIIASGPRLHTCRTQEGWLFVDSVFPIRLGIWEYARPDRVPPPS